MSGVADCPLCLQNGGALWPSERPRARVARPQQDARLGNISLIPLRGNESEMRNSVAAFATDPLTVSDLGALDAPPCGAASPLHHMMGGSWSPNLGGGISWLPFLIYCIISSDGAGGAS